MSALLLAIGLVWFLGLFALAVWQLRERQLKRGQAVIPAADPDWTPPAVHLGQLWPVEGGGWLANCADVQCSWFQAFAREQRGAADRAALDHTLQLPEPTWAGVPESAWRRAARRRDRPALGAGIDDDAVFRLIERQAGQLMTGRAILGAVERGDDVAFRPVAPVWWAHGEGLH